jgi:hypothetical protein
MSYAPSAPLSIEELSEQLASAIRQFGDGPYILVGVHTGSTLALELATRTLRGDVAQVVFSGLSLLTTDEISQFQRILSDPVIDKEGKTYGAFRSFNKEVVVNLKNEFAEQWSAADKYSVEEFLEYVKSIY